MSDSDDDVIAELGDEALSLDAMSTDTMLVFRLVVPDADVALGTMNVMFRGDESVMEAVKDVFLCVIVNGVPIVIGTTTIDPDMTDVRVLLVKEWKRSLPLPLTGLATKLAIVVHHTGDISSRHVKFGGDIVKCMDALRDVKWKKTSGTTVLHFRNQLTRIESGFDCHRSPVTNLVIDESGERKMRPPPSGVTARAIPRVFAAARIPWNL